MLSRVPEMAVRLATIRAIGRAKKATPVIDRDDIQWACEMALWSAERMISDADSYMVESDHQGRANEVLRFIKQAPEGKITHTALSRKVKHKYDSRALRLVLDGLQDTGQIEILRQRSDDPNAKKPTDFIRYIG